MKHLVVFLFITLIIVSPHSLKSSANADGDLVRFQVLFMKNFLKYFQWPEQKTEYTVGIYNNDIMFDQFMKERHKGLKINVIKLKNASPISPCDMVFVPTEKSSIISKILSQAYKNNVLIVTENFKSTLTDNGAAIIFTLQNNKLRFKIFEDNSSKMGIKPTQNIMSLSI